MTMKQARIAELKAKLSEYLRAVRGGDEVLVLDRDTPVARIVPAGRRNQLQIRKRAPGVPPLNKVKTPGRLELEVDPVELLLEDRRERL
jgi:prevent-host-death family protein